MLDGDIMLRNLTKVSRFVEQALYAALAVIAFSSFNPLLRKIITVFVVLYFYVLRSYVNDSYTEATERSQHGSTPTSFIPL